LLQSGFDDMDTLISMTDDDMKDLGIPRGHVVKLRKCLRAFECYQICRTTASQAAHRQMDHRTSPNIPGRLAFTRESEAPSVEEKTAVQKSWAFIQEFGIARFGEMLFGELFQQDPAALAFFPPEVCDKYWDWTMDIKCSASSKAPMAPQLFSKVATLIGGAVIGLHDVHCLVQALVRLGARHLAYGVNQAHLNILAKALVKTLRTCLGDEFTPDVELAWLVVFNFITATMLGGMRAASTPEPSQGPKQESDPISTDRKDATGVVCIPSVGEELGSPQSA